MILLRPRRRLLGISHLHRSCYPEDVGPDAACSPPALPGEVLPQGLVTMYLALIRWDLSLSAGLGRPMM